jgi:hypothetical protein
MSIRFSLIWGLFAVAQLYSGDDLQSGMTSIDSLEDLRKFSGKIVVGYGPLWDKISSDAVIMRNCLEVVGVELAVISKHQGLGGSVIVIPVRSAQEEASEVWIEKVGSTGNVLREANVFEKRALAAALELESVRFAGGPVFSLRLKEYFKLNN